MNIKKLFNHKISKPEPELFLAVEIHESLIKTAVWQLDQTKPSIISLGSFELWDSEESLINGVDASLTTAVKDLSSQPDRVILGLPEPWLEKDKIHPSKTSLIKNLLKELNLKPIGLVTTTQAIIHHLKSKEGVPPTAILLEIYPDKITVTVAKLGQIRAVEEVGRSGELTKDVQEGLARLDLDQLPPRFILSNGSELETEQQQLLSFPWQDNLPFLHLPKVEILPPEFSIQAIALAGGSEAVASLGLITSNTKSELKPSIKPHPPMSVPTTSNQTFVDLGFSLESGSIPPPKDTKPLHEPLEPESESVVDSDSETKTSSSDATQKSVPSPSLENKKSFLSSLTTTYKKFISFFTQLSFLKPSTNFKRKPFLVITISLLVLSTVITPLVYFSQAKASILVTVTKKTFEQTIDVSISNETKSGSISLPLKIQTLSASVSETIPTTGETLVGDKAKGAITLYNRTSEPIEIESDTIIESNNLIFKIDDDVVVASKSANIVAGTEEFGKASDISVTAAQIGADHNLSKDTQFNVDNYSKTIIYAVASNNFTGGTSRTVKAVSEKDQQLLIDIATDKITSQIQSQLEQQDPQISASAFADIKYTQKEYSHDINEETTDVSLNLTGERPMLLYSKQAIIDQLNSTLVTQSDPGMLLKPNSTDIKLNSPTEISTDYYTTQAEITGPLVPILNIDQLVSQLKGKSIKHLKSILSTIPRYHSAKVTIYPKIPFLSNYLPLKTSNINLDLTTP